MGIRCRDCSRHFDTEEELEGHDCDGENVTVLVQNPSNNPVGNPARVYESREDAERVREEIGYDKARIIDAPLIPAGEVDDGE